MALPGPHLYAELREQFTELIARTFAVPNRMFGLVVGQCTATEVVELRSRMQEDPYLWYGTDFAREYGDAVFGVDVGRDARTTQILLEAGVITREEAREHLSDDVDFIYSLRTNAFGVTGEQIRHLMGQLPQVGQCWCRGASCSQRGGNGQEDLQPRPTSECLCFQIRYGGLTDPAVERSQQLLRDWLSPSQREQYDKDSTFQVIGNVSKKRYKIRSDRSSYNIEDDFGDRYCFVPYVETVANGLPKADILLAQKLALELDEDGALAIANKRMLSLHGRHHPPQPRQVTVRTLDPIVFEYYRHAAEHNEVVTLNGGQFLVQIFSWNHTDLGVDCEVKLVEVFDVAVAA